MALKAFKPGKTDTGSIDFSGAASLFGNAFGFATDLFSAAKASEQREKDLRAQARSLGFDVGTLKIDAKQARIQGKLTVVLAEDELNDAQASNMVGALARGVSLSGSVTRVQEKLSKDNSFFDAITLYSSNISALKLERTANFKAKQANELTRAANKEANSLFGNALFGL